MIFGLDLEHRMKSDALERLPQETSKKPERSGGAPAWAQKASVTGSLLQQQTLGSISKLSQARLPGTGLRMADVSQFLFSKPAPIVQPAQNPM